jgi:hypothetical protein
MHLAYADSASCCETMQQQLAWRCPYHESPHDCPNALVGRFGHNRTYGLYVHDDGSSYVTINNCPWCGAPLSETKT